jgi:DNA-binding beta-propeller fold protein YncE
VLAPILLVALAVGCSDDSGTATPAGESYAGTIDAPEFPEGLEWLNVREPLRIHEDLTGKAVLLDFWTLGCINCQHIVPDLKRLEAEFGSELVVIGVHSGKYDTERGLASIGEAVQRYGLEHPVVNDANFRVWDAYGVHAWPTLTLIDPAGKVVGQAAGEGVYDTFQPIIEAVLNDFRARGEVNGEPIPVELAATARSSFLSYPGKVQADEAGDRLFIADSANHRLLITGLSDGRLQRTIGDSNPGLADGPYSEARFRGPQGMALSADGRLLYVADTLNHAIRVVDLQSETVTTLGGTGRQARVPPNGSPGTETDFASPWDVLVWEDYLYVASAGVHQIWRMQLDGSSVEVFAGTGREGIDNWGPNFATLAQPEGLASDGAYLYWVDAESSSLRRTLIDGSGKVETLVGTGLFDFGDKDGKGKDAVLQHPEGVAYAGGLVYIADTYNHKVKVFDPESEEVTTILGTGEAGSDDARGLLDEPSGLTVAGGKLYVADRNNDAVRVFNLDRRTLSTLELGSIVTGLEEGGEAPVVALPALAVSPDSTNLTLRLTTPDGYHLNSLAPSRLSASSEDPNVASFEGDEVTWNTDEPSVDLSIPVALAPGQTEASLTIQAYYCRTGEEALCFIHEVTLQLPLSVEPGAAPAALTYELPEQP